MSASVREIVDYTGLALVCDLPESRGHQRWLVIGQVPEAARYLSTHQGLNLGDTDQAQAHAQAAGVRHGA